MQMSTEPSELSEYPLTQKQRAMAKGKYLDGKLKLLLAMGNLTQAERRFIGVAHYYRDELYHVGLNHDGIIRAIAGRYFVLCCDLFVRMNNLRILGPVFSSDDRYSEVTKRYLPLTDGRLDFFEIDYEDLAKKLRMRLPTDLPNLPQTLAGEAHDAIWEVLNNFEFLVRNNPRGTEDKEMLEIVQWHRDLEQAVEREDGHELLEDSEFRKNYLGVKTESWKDWMQRYTSIPSEKWYSRAGLVELETDPLVAMDLYQSLRNDMAYLEEAIKSEAQELDRWIQIEIDRIRGK